MNIKKYIYSLLDLPQQEIKEQLVTQGIGYAVYHLSSLYVAKIKLSGLLDIGLFNHIHEQISAFGRSHEIRYLLIDMSQSIELSGSLTGLSKLHINLPLDQSVVVLLPDWSEKKNHIRFLNLIGIHNIRFFFSFAGATNWIRAQNSASKSFDDK